MMSPWSGFSKLMQSIYQWQQARFVWLLMALVCVALVLVAHYGFQEYGYMKPCEQCVYIRYAFLVIALGGLLAAINPRSTILRAIGYALGLYGAIRGVMFSLTLGRIHKAVHGGEIFGVQGCSAVPHFDFALPLHIWLPSLFSPTGDCGFDAPIVPEDVVLEGFRKVFVEAYQNGWYLVPSYEFGSMAQCCLFAYVVCLIILALMLVSHVFRATR